MKETEYKSYFRYWGKADPNYPGDPKWHPLVYHCLNIADSSDYILAREPASTHVGMTVNLGVTREGAMPRLVNLIACYFLGEAYLGIQFQIMAVNHIYLRRAI
jgi:hypothetical protein